ncbi:MAG: sugar ABC transporter substrate-binding protein [Planctomycetota bacterium]|nr:MAG: sugar ABC transporter substrate-binding protein [Planctomycetota bacterium]
MGRGLGHDHEVRGRGGPRPARVCAGALLALLVGWPVRAGGQQPPFDPIPVVFFNIGEPAPFWDVVEAFMRAAARDLAIELEVLNARGDHLRMIEQAAAVAARPPAARPRYAVINSEKQAGGPMLESLVAAGIPTLLAFNVFIGEDRDRYGAPRERFPLWLGSIRPDNEQAGHDIAARLLAAAAAAGFEEPSLGVLAIGGSRATPAAIARERGLARALAGRPGVRLLQLVHSRWERAKARRQVQGLLRRYPQTRVIWAANDPMALGAMEAVIDHGREPGRDVLIGGLNWSTEALREIQRGRLVTSVGGHFMGGGWALVLLRDYHDGYDFAEPEGTEIVFRMGVIDRDNVEAYQHHFGREEWDRIDFSRLLRSRRPRGSRYDFSLQALLAQFEE